MPLSPVLEKIKASRERKKAMTLIASPRARSMKRRPYQQEDIEWLVENKRGILGWAPGLGKTFGASEAAEPPIMISCPLNLVEQWREFVEDQYPMWKVVVAAYGDVIKRDAALKSPFDVMIVNHDMFRTFAMPNVTTLIIDEIHHFRNREAQRSKWLRAYAHRTERVYGLSATPIYKDVGDLWHQLVIIDPNWKETWGTYNQFIGNYAWTSNSGWGEKVIKIKNEPVLKKRYAPFIKERTYNQVGMFLPDRIDKQVILKMDPKFRKNVYDELRVYFRKQIEEEEGGWQRFANAGAVLHELRKILVTDEKLAAVKELIDDVPGDKPVIVFVWYKDTAAKVAEALDGIEITGDINPEKRRQLALTGGPEKKRVRVATMASLSEGVDLSAARTVFFVEEDYVPGRNYQAMTRVQRHSTTGITEPVNAYWVRYENSIDEIVHNTAKSRTTGNAMQVLREALA